MKSTIDHNTIATWKEATDAFRAKVGFSFRYAALAVLASLILFAFFHSFYFLIPVPFLVIYAIVLQLAEKTDPTLVCPNCGKCPVGMSEGSPLRAVSCTHCHYWLVNPVGTEHFNN
jgi:hypothetical protein